MTPLLKVRIVPRAKNNAIEGWMEDGSLKVRVQAPPVDGKANDALIRLLAQTLGFPARNISLRSGHTGRNKILAFAGITPEGLQKLLKPLIR